MRELRCRPLEPATFAPFGVVIDAHAREPECINDGCTQRHAELARLAWQLSI